MKKIKIGLLDSSVASNMLQLNSLLLAQGSVRRISPGERDATFDLIVLPDGGVSPNLATFYHGGEGNIPIGPMCPMVEYFRVHSLEYYINSYISVIGIGGSAIILWDYLQQKSVFTSHGNMLLCPRENSGIDILGPKDVYIDAFRQQNPEYIIGGVSRVDSRFEALVIDTRVLIHKLATIESAPRDDREDREEFFQV